MASLVIETFDWKGTDHLLTKSKSATFVEVLNYRLNHGDLIRCKAPEMVAIKKYILEKIDKESGRGGGGGTGGEGRGLELSFWTHFKTHFTS